jgi:hypothetical protein
MEISVEEGAFVHGRLTVPAGRMWMAVLGPPPPPEGEEGQVPHPLSPTLALPTRTNGPGLQQQLQQQQQGPRGVSLFFHQFELEQRLLPGRLSARVELATPVCAFTGRTQAQVRLLPLAFMRRTQSRTADTHSRVSVGVSHEMAPVSA